jgi:MFS family permease
MSSTTSVPSRPPQRRAGSDATRPFAGTVAFAAAAMLVSYLPFSAVNGVLGRIGEEAGAGTDQLQWVTDSFTVALTGAVLIAGALAERHGRRRITVVGLAVTALGSLLGWLAGGLTGSSMIHLLWGAQAVVGVGGGLVMSATLSLIAATAPSAQARTRSISVWAAANVIGLGSGPFLSASVSSAVPGIGGWRWLFGPVIALAAVVAVSGPVFARELVSTTGGRLDLTGQILGTLGIVALVYGVINGGSAGWTEVHAAGGLTFAFVLLVAFFLVEKRAADPVLRPDLFTSRGFTAAGLASAAALFTVIAVVFLFSLYLAGQGVSDLGIAERIGFLFAGNAVASVASGLLQNRYGPTRVLLGSLVVALAGVITLLSVDADTGLPALAWRLAVIGAGCGSVVATSTAVAVSSVPGPLSNMAGTANNVIRQLGGALGPALIGGVLASRLAAGDDLVAAIHACAGVLIAVVAVAVAGSAGLLLHRSTPQPTH